MDGPVDTQAWMKLSLQGKGLCTRENKENSSDDPEREDQRKSCAQGDPKRL